MDFQFTDATTATAKGVIVLPVAANRELLGFAKKLDKAMGGILRQTLAQQVRFTGAKDQVLWVNGFSHPDITHVLLYGVDSVKTLQEDDFRKLGSTLTAQFNHLGLKEAQVFVQDLEIRNKNNRAAALTAFGAKVKSYRFDSYKTKLKPEQNPSLTHLSFVVANKNQARNDWKTLSGLTEGIFLARDLVTEPPNKIYAEKFVQRVKESIKGLPLKVKLLNEEQMRKLGMGLLLCVNQASDREPYTLILEYTGLKNKKGFDLALVGKGVTFDTGGISIKPALNMWDMKSDMAGGAAVVGAMRALAHRGAKANVVGLVGLVENVISDEAVLPSDVVTSMCGQTVEVLNTDAEGRLVLADVMWYAQENYKPKIMLDIATLTGAVVVALAGKYAGIFTDDDDLADQLSDAGHDSGDQTWRLPIDATSDQHIDSHIADMANHAVAGGAGASTGAVFLKRFVQKDVAWAHIDMAGMAWNKAPTPMNPLGASGFGVRLFDQFVRDFIEK